MTQPAQHHRYPSALQGSSRMPHAPASPSAASAENLCDRRPGLPQLGLHLHSGALTMRIPTQAELAALADEASHPGAIVSPGSEHHLPSLMGKSGTQFAQDLIDNHARAIPILARNRWALPFGIFEDNQLIGLQRSWLAEPATLTTSSWLLRAAQGLGYGTLVRQMALTLAFEHLHLDQATTALAPDNIASRAVSEKCGYVLTNKAWTAPDDPTVTGVEYTITATAWDANPVGRPRVTTCGVAPFLMQLDALPGAS